MALILDPIFFPALATSSKQKIVSPVRRTNFSPRAATHKPVENRVPLGCGAVAAEKAARYTITSVDDENVKDILDEAEADLDNIKSCISLVEDALEELLELKESRESLDDDFEEQEEERQRRYREEEEREEFENYIAYQNRYFKF